RRRCRRWVVGPGMLGISAAHVLYDVAPTPRPEAGQVFCRLDRPSRGRGDCQDERDLAVGHVGVISQSKQRLSADFDCGSRRGRIIDQMATSRGAAELGRRKTIDLSYSIVSEQTLKRCCDA